VSGSSGAADLLLQRRLNAEVLLKAARVTTDDTSDSVARAIQRARDFASRSSTPGANSDGPGAAHLLFALCQERASAAHRALEQCGADVAKLRTAAMQLAMGPALLLGQPVAAPTSQTPSPRPATGALRHAVRLLRAMDGDELARAIRMLGALRARRLRPQGRHRATKKSSPLSRG